MEPGTIRISPILNSGNNYSIHIVFNTLDEARMYKTQIKVFLEEFMDAIVVCRTNGNDIE